MALTRDTGALADRLRWLLVATPATPMRADGSTDLDVCSRYFEHLVRAGAGALAVAAHAGRGTHLPVPAKAELVRRAGALGVPVLAGVAGSDHLAWAEAAAAAGADGLLVYPPEVTEADAVIAHHEELWDACELPMVAVDLYSRPYPYDVLVQLLDHRGVVAIEAARWHDAIACQEGIAAARLRGCLALTGENRMLGASLMWGAEGALLALAAAAVPVTAAAVKTFAAAVHTSARDAAARFLDVSAIVDELGRVTFRPPYDGYVQRLLWIAADEGAIPEEFAVDPFRPGDLDDAERAGVLRVARQCLEQVRR